VARRETYEKLIQEMDEKLQFPGLSNTWTMPVENRLDMELTGIKTPLGMKVQGPNVDGIQQVASQIQIVLSGLPQVRSVFSEKVAQGFYVKSMSIGRRLLDTASRLRMFRRRSHRASADRISPRTSKARALSHQCPLPERLSATMSKDA